VRQKQQNRKIEPNQTAIGSVFGFMGSNRNGSWGPNGLVNNAN
jgi:hypothetical protein